nr:alanine racemase [bacterium]
MLQVSSAHISLAAFRHNLEVLKGRLLNPNGFMAVVKADGYGHGASRIAREAMQMGARGVCVARPAEAMALREEGFDAPILLLQPTDNLIDAAELARLDVACAAGCSQQLNILSEGARLEGKPIRVHMKVDTGMHRLGFSPEQAVQALGAFGRELMLEGIFTHFAVADEDEAFTRMQHDRLMQVVSCAKKAGMAPLVHAANTAAALRYPDMQHDFVRLGIGMYGYDAPDTPFAQQLTPVLSWRAPITQIMWIEPGESTSYGLHFHPTRKTRLATIGVGYADGYARALGCGVGQVMVAGQRAPVCGNVCMDQMMVDVTDIPQADIGGDVWLLGGGPGGVTADEMAAWRATISYEVLCNIAPRVIRVYE